MNRIILAAALAAAPVVAAAQTAPSTNPAATQGGTYRVEPSHTRILFAVSHMAFTTWYGNFTNASGTLTLVPGDVAKSSFDITVPANSISTTNAKLDGELNSPEWFDTAKYPTIEFKSERVVRTGPKTARVTGALTFHGVTRPETLNVTFNAAGLNPLTKAYTAGFNATGTIDRADFNQKTYAPLIGTEVTLTISAAFVK